MGTIHRLPARVRPLRKRYSPDEPYEIEREDLASGAIVYRVMDMRPDFYREVAAKDDDGGRDPSAKHDMEQVARALNMLVAMRIEVKPPMPKRASEGGDIDDFEFDDED
jgi:hypothetical protein